MKVYVLVNGSAMGGNPPEGAYASLEAAMRGASAGDAAVYRDEGHLYWEGDSGRALRSRAAVGFRSESEAREHRNAAPGAWHPSPEWEIWTMEVQS